jgi:hypothetical protein
MIAKRILRCLVLIMLEGSGKGLLSVVLLVEVIKSEAL